MSQNIEIPILKNISMGSSNADILKSIKNGKFDKNCLLDGRNRAGINCLKICGMIRELPSGSRADLRGYEITEYGKQYLKTIKMRF